MTRAEPAQDGDDEHRRPAAEHERGVGQPLNGQHGPGQRAGVSGPPGRPGQGEGGVEHDEEGGEEHIQRQAVLPRAHSKPHVVQAMSSHPGHPGPRIPSARPDPTKVACRRPRPSLRSGRTLPAALPGGARGGMQWGHAHRTADHAGTPARPLRDRRQPVDGDIPHPAHVRARPRPRHVRDPVRLGGHRRAAGRFGHSCGDRHGELPDRKRAARPERAVGPVPGRCPVPGHLLPGRAGRRGRQDHPRDAHRARRRQAGQPVHRPAHRGRAVVHRHRHRPRRPDRVRRYGHAGAGRPLSRPDAEVRCVRR